MRERQFSRFVAIGDSTTEGLDDPDPAGDGYLGWADRLAVRLAERNPGLEYANLAVRGRQAAAVRAEQLAPALALRPDLISVIAGVNDLITLRCDVAKVLGHLDAMYAAARATGATVLTITQPDPVAVARMAARPVLRRLAEYNRGIRAAAERHGLVLVDFARIPEATHPVFWSVDRLHLNSLGHAGMAATVAVALGLPVADDEPVIGPAGAGWSPPATPVPDRRAVRAQDVEWVRRHLGPWVWRHVRGRSSGDGLVAKRPTPAEIRRHVADVPLRRADSA